MKIRVERYTLSGSPLVQAFVDVKIDGWLRFNGLNFLRDGTLRPAQLIQWRNRNRLYRDAVDILDADLSKLLAGDILAAIEAHIALLPEERRLRAPVPPKPKPSGAELPPAKPGSSPIKADFNGDR